MQKASFNPFPIFNLDWSETLKEWIVHLVSLYRYSENGSMGPNDLHRFLVKEQSMKGADAKFAVDLIRQFEPSPSKEMGRMTPSGTLHSPLSLFTLFTGEKNHLNSNQLGITIFSNFHWSLFQDLLH